MATKEGFRRMTGAVADEFIADFYLEESLPSGKSISTQWCHSQGNGHTCTRPKGHLGIHVSIHQSSGKQYADHGVDTWFD